MKKIILSTVFMLLALSAFSQEIKDFKKKNSSNKTDRTMMLDILRAKLYEDYKMKFVFVVNHFKMGNDYAWFKGDVQRKDGKKVELFDEDAPNDCCHIECLFKKSWGKWLIVESAAFATDVWWEGIEDRYPDVPKGILIDKN